MCCHYTRGKDHGPNVAVTDQSPFCQSQTKYLHMSSSPDLTTCFRSIRRPHQSGFFHCRSTLDAILELRLLAEIHSEFQQPMHVAFVDLRAAFLFRRQERALEGHAWGRCSLGTHEPDHRPAHCNVLQSAPSRPPLRTIHDDLRCKAGTVSYTHLTLPTKRIV